MRSSQFERDELLKTRVEGVARIRIILHGKATSDARLRTAVSALRNDGGIVEVRVTWEAGDAARLTGEALADASRGKIDCIVAGGGDGTINEVFATAHEAGLPDGCSLGIIPMGSANDFAHSADVPTGDIAKALSIAASASPRWIDVGLLNGRLFVNLVSGGFGSRVTVETDPRLKQRLGGLAYAITGISRFAELSENQGMGSLGKASFWPWQSAMAGRPAAAYRYVLTP